MGCLRQQRQSRIVALSMLLLGIGSAELAAQTKDAPEDYLGLVVRDLDPQETQSLGVDENVRGVVVDEVEVGGGADAAGLEAGDVITHVDERSIKSRDEFLRAVERRQPGDRVRLRAQREGRERRFTVELGRHGRDWSADPQLLTSEVRALLRPGVQLGVQCVDLVNPQLAAYFGVEDGVLVSDVVEDSGAAAAGVQGGDVILAVAGANVHDVAALRRELQRFDTGDEVELRLRRSGKEQTVRVELQRDKGAFTALSLPGVERWRHGEDTEALRRELQDLRRELEQLQREWKSERR